MEPPPKVYRKSIYSSDDVDQDKDGDTFLKSQKTEDVHLKVSPKGDINSIVKRSSSRLGQGGEYLDKQPRMERDADLAAMTQEMNQEDGVAHMWHREMGVLDDVDK